MMFSILKCKEDEVTLILVFFDTAKRRCRSISRPLNELIVLLNEFALRVFDFRLSLGNITLPNHTTSANNISEVS